MSKMQIGVIGLGVMGQNLALNIERNGFGVAGFDLSPEKMSALAGKFSGHRILLAGSLGDLVNNLESPRRILLMVPAGKPVDDVMEKLSSLLNPGDILIDGGNSFFKDTDRRFRELNQRGVLYIGTGVSGGEEGALLGPSIMPGGAIEAWPKVKDVFQAISAKALDGQPCCEWIGAGGAGHFVKMVHNGIEYADMQMIAEAYQLLDRGLGMPAADLADVFKQWNQTELNSYLIEITGHILEKTDPKTGAPMVDVILDTAGQKGTGKWTSQIALDLGSPSPTIAEAVFARFVSAVKDDRVAASRILNGPSGKLAVSDRGDFVEAVRKALYASKICSYAQGFELMLFASREYKFDLRFGDIASIWRAGCIIRAQFLSRIREAYERKPGLSNLLLDPYFKAAIDENQAAWRRVVAESVQAGLPVPAFASALAYYDSYRSPRLPANLLQAQRDFFGAHTYERVDQPRGTFFHTEWGAQ